MTTITREQTLKIIEAADEVISALAGTNEDVHPGSDNMLRLWDDLNDRYAPPEVVRELARIVLASLEAEPVLYQSCTRPTWNSGVPWTEWKERSREGYEDDLRFTDTPDHAGWINKCRKLYTTPPVPVIQADVAQAIENLKQKLVECNRYNYCADAVKGVEDACHAAMLQGSQPVSQTYKFPVNTPCQDAPAHIWLQTAGVWPEDGELSELTWCSHNQHHDDTLYVRADLVNGNSQVTPDGWISCSERMPAQDDWILIYSKHGEYMAGQVQGEYVELSDGTLSWLGNALFWMLLPEPPQEAGQ
ncbi:DUF551 domain-containing protein [Escherichia coli]|uniref:DUF551 domain-containing protein n=1 Tax=Salmonella enterica TaxID=28901 RepID=UPI000D124B84|nr:DUF551 domain-containing protein [Salmonella enterica]EET5195377.1 DUF551 domain-containing protein [Escherichia coli]EFQ0070423.1 DUF551 domain-containing protein [Shigella flexneri]MBJ4129478.1 DUF551 domain-containing protein [Salmonella enterica subsp. enterica serovar Derby]MBS2269727.1 DUF551 domain-containing protein [Salmonella enterica subsp. enterica serovar 1,4,[5],12:i:-]MBT0983276.1 DUF551 domain-containing protein [Salmonella enterica subsp. enterica serovar Typhimurium]HBN30